MEEVTVTAKEELDNECRDMKCFDGSDVCTEKNVSNVSVISDAEVSVCSRDEDAILDDNLHKNSSAMVSDILDHVQSCTAVFKSQQVGDPELTIEDKRTLAESLLYKNPFGFLVRFGQFLHEHHFQYFMSLEDPAVVEQAKQLRMDYHHSNKQVLQKNRRYEALKRLEAEGSYFSEAEMEKREPLLYHQLVGQFLTEKERLIKHRQSMSDSIPTFSNFLIDKMEKDEIIALRKSQEEAENCLEIEVSEDESLTESIKKNPPRWGDDWIDAENANKIKTKKKKVKKVNLSKQEKALLSEEFKSLMYAKFLNGLDTEFNYADVDLNPDYDSLQTRAQDEEDKYFDEESCGSNVCTDTGIEDY